MNIKVGDKVDMTSLKTVDGKAPPPLSTGERCVVYFYPRDDTPGCTTEGREFTALLDKFGAQRVRIYGVSADSADSHKRFQQKCEIGAELLIDSKGLLGQALGNWKGRNHARSTMVLDDQGTVLALYEDVKAPGHAAQVLKDLGGG